MIIHLKLLKCSLYAFKKKKDCSVSIFKFFKINMRVSMFPFYLFLKKWFFLHQLSFRTIQMVGYYQKKKKIQKVYNIVEQ